MAILWPRPCRTGANDREPHFSQEENFNKSWEILPWEPMGKILWLKRGSSCSKIMAEIWPVMRGHNYIYHNLTII